ncbi:uracil-DNA glycosylase [Lapillicoccus sp.]|uniref:uracil-DNA glycosylase n=1 Tax=Lapillicoccus sp. TaxID=1909287 RepID=UPI00398393F1
MRDDVRISKLARLDQDHVAVLSELVRSWRQGPDGRRTVPWFDPDGGGVRARVLLLMEAPGPHTLRDGDDGFCSEENADPTNRAVRAARARAGLDQRECLKWNVMPWTPTDRDGRWAAPRVGDLEAARPALVAILRHLPELRAVITFGAPALSGLMRALTLETPTVVVPVLGVPHPSQRNARRREESGRRIATAFDWAALRANEGRPAT